MIALQLVKRTDPRYQDIRDRHYIPNRGCHGQQLHYLVYDYGALVGIISGASSVYGCAPRDKFFGLSKDRETKQAQLNQIVNNVVFRLERPRPNLATQVLALWRKRIADDWKFLYNVPVLGFETFVIEAPGRVGTLYKADNWTQAGLTQGNTKAHETVSKSGGLNTKHTRRETEPKLIFCLRRKGVRLIDSYTASWQDPIRARKVAKRRQQLYSRQIKPPAGGEVGMAPE